MGTVRIENQEKVLLTIKDASRVVMQLGDVYARVLMNRDWSDLVKLDKPALLAKMEEMQTKPMFNGMRVSLQRLSDGRLVIGWNNP